ncbi:MAG TPA: PA14 domain-containing protein [Polyangia bacterium]|nr:PA14 domain-containing protein [Polyangia bacterium]
MPSGRAGVWFVVAAVAVAACVNLSYPPGASRDGGAQALVSHLGNGKACTEDGDCASGHCNDNVCCKTDCSAMCFSCALAGNEGVCMPTPMLTKDPRGQCTDDGATNCGHNGLCDGAGNCQKYPVGTPCKDAVCTSPHDVTLASRCSADGVCVAVPAQKCYPYLCDGAKCLTSCTGDQDCENRVLCVAGSCGQKALGTACTDGSQCDSTFCAQGVCCATACAGGCMSCALTGSEGACTAVQAGTQPADASCAASDPSTCGLDGTCDGAGSCRNYPMGTTCSPASCMSAMLRPAGACDGKAHCQIPTQASCGGFNCASATSCKTTCGSDLDCQSPSVCGGGACGGLVGQYFRTTNLTDLAFMHTDAAINFNWGGGSPNGLPVDSFSIRWRGKITARFTDTYTFYAATDDGERLIIGGVTRIDHFVRHSTIPADTATVPMTAGVPVDFEFDYFENGGDASAVLSWSSASGKEPMGVIPTSAFSPQ